MLKVDHFSVAFGMNVVVDKVSLSCAAGEITAIIGPNGAGKTTLFDAITGYSRPSGGTVACDGVDITGRLPYRVARSGIARTFQTPRLFDGMSVMENLVVACPDGGLPTLVWSALSRTGVRAFEKRARNKALHWLNFLKLRDKRDSLAADLSGGQRKLVELGRALMTEPKFVLLDEPVAGVAPALVSEIGSHLRDLALQGLGIVVIEHNMDFIMRNSDRVFVLANGCVLAQGTAAEIQAHPEVLEAYLGGAA